MGACAAAQRHPSRVVPCATQRDGALESYVSYDGPGPWFTCAPDGEMLPRLARYGVAGPDTEPTTLPRLLAQIAAGKKARKVALLVERPVPALQDGGRSPPQLPRQAWTAWSFQRYLADAQCAAKALLRLGFPRFGTLNVWGFNAPEWNISALAAMLAGGKCAGLYPTDTAAAAAYKVVHSAGCVVVVEDRAKVDRLAAALSDRDDADCLKAFVAYGFEPAAGATVEVAGCGALPLLSWAGLLELGRREGSDEEVEKRTAALRPGHCAALIYTSGTTGEPKAVMISHDNLIFEASTVLSALETCGFCTSPTEERLMSYLPLSHVAGLLLDIVAPLVATARKKAWVTVFFARPYDLKIGSLRDRLQSARPTAFLGVPLVWEKIADRIRAIGAQTKGLKRKIADTAKRMALEKAKSSQLGGDGRVPFGFSLVDKALLSKVKAKLGLDQCKFAATAAAPIRVDTLAYFGSLGICIHEVYGMSECTGAATGSNNQAHSWGSCGLELPAVEVRAFLVHPADINQKVECPRAPRLDCMEEKYQGELCFRGRNIMMGYMACADMGPAHVADVQRRTAETIDEDGWLHSGDKGLITEQGMARITGRYKELIIGEGGENIAPVPIEDEVKRRCDGVADVMMVGDKRKYNVALITLKAVGANGEVPGTDILDDGAKLMNPAVETITEAMDDMVWIGALTSAVMAANNNPKCCPNSTFKIQKFTILPTNFSEEGGELTPTKKLKRKAVEIAWARTIENMYATTGVYIRYVA